MTITNNKKMYCENENISSVFHMDNEDYVTIFDGIYNDKPPYDLSIPVKNETRLELNTCNFRETILNKDEDEVEIPYKVAAGS